MRWTPASRTVVLAVLAGLAAFQLIGLTTALVGATRERVTDFGIIGPDLGGYSHLARLRTTGGLPIDSVWGPALAAGLEPGDVVTHIDGVPMVERPGVWYRGRFTTPPDTVLHLTVRRGGETFGTALRTTRLAEPLRIPLGFRSEGRPRMDYRAFHWWAWGPNLLLSLQLFIVGLAMGILRRNDPTAWTFALVFLGVSLATSISDGTPLLHVWPPGLVAFWSLAAFAGIGYSMPLTVYGLMRFPAMTRLSRRLWPWRWVPFVLIGSCAAVEMAIALMRNAGLSVPPGTSQAVDTVFNFSLAVGFTCMAALLVAHQFEPAGRGGERLNVLWNGSMCAVLGGLWSVLIPAQFWHWLMRPLGTPGVWLALAFDDIVPALLVCMLPLSFGYTILARRLFGIRFVIRRGLQHLLFSRGVLAVEAVLLFIVLEHTIRGGGSVLGVQRPVVAGVLSLLVVAGLALVNRPLMQALDRRFFRDRYDARRVLLGLGQDLGRLRGRGEILRHTGESILAALHPARVGIFLRREPRGRLHAAWRSDAEAIAPADSEREADQFTERLAVAGQDLVWHESGTQPAAVEPPEPGETPAFGTEPPAGPPPYELGIQVRQSTGNSGCIALAAKRSEEPYSAEDRELLVTVANQAALALENADLLEVAQREAQLAREVEIARDVQRNLFPRELPQVPGWEVAAVCRPARTVAGDYYDVLRDADGALGVALGDVSGKGVGASLLSAGLHAMVRGRLPGPGCDLARLLEDLNAHLVESSAEGMFATLVVARIDPASGRATYVNAGHPPPVLVTTHGTRWLDDGGPLAGVIRRARYTPGHVALAPGDMLVIYSDGVTEAERARGEMFGDERLLDALRSARGGSAAGTMEAVLRAVEGFSGNEDPADDISLIVVRRLP